MGQNSNIEWTDNTFNPWVGCVKVSEGCKHCYAEELMTRKGRWANTWGPAQTTERIKTSADNWRKPLAWNKQAAKEGKRVKVFCASLADVFEDNEQVSNWRSDLWDLIELTPNLDWLLLTKRPENISRFTKRWDTWEQLPANIWLGTTVENQEQAEKRIPELLRIPAAVRFLSCEPLLGPINLTGFNGTLWGKIPPGAFIHWVIVGGESGPNARPMHPNWARSLRDQCKAAGVAFFMKQWGEWIAKPQIATFSTAQDWPDWEFHPGWRDVIKGKEWGCLGISGKYLECTTTWNGRQGNPDDDYEVTVYKVGKHAAGRLLDGETWSEFPQPERV